VRGPGRRQGARR